MVKIKSKIGLDEEVVLIDNFGNEVKVLLKKDEIYDVHEEVAKIFVENNWGEIVEKEFEKFLDFLDFFNENGYFEVRLIRNDVKIREFFERKEDLVKFLIGNGFENYDVFVSLNKRKNKGGTINDVNDNVRIIFVDIDKEMGEKEIEEINRKLWESGFNAMIIAKSGKGLHLYFVLDKYISKDEFYELSEIFYEYLENLLNVKIDRLNIDVSRCVRLVGSYNHKYIPKRYVSFYVIRNFKDEVFYVKVDKIKGLEEYKRNKIREKFNEIKYLFESFIVGDANKDEVRSEMIKILQDFDIDFFVDNEIFKKMRIAEEYREKGKIFDAQKLESETTENAKMLLELLCITKYFKIDINLEEWKKYVLNKIIATELYRLAIEREKNAKGLRIHLGKIYKISSDEKGMYFFDGNKKYYLNDFNAIFEAYYKYVFAEKLSELLRKISSISSEFNKRYEWIEYVFNNAEKFYDGRVRFLMFCGYRYLVCIKNYDFDKAYEICKNFIERTEKERVKRGMKSRSVLSWLRSSLKNFIFKVKNGKKIYPIGKQKFIELLVGNVDNEVLENYKKI